MSWHKLFSTDGIDYIQKQKSVKVNTERFGDLDRFPFPNGLSVMPVEELKQFQKFWVNFDCAFIDISIFADGDDFKKQPKIVNRNFIGHGMLTSNVKKRDCIQLFLLYYNFLSFFDTISS